MPLSCFVLGVIGHRRSLAGRRWQVAVGWAHHSAAAPLSALLRIGGKSKPRSTEASGASRTGNFGEGAGALFPVHLRKTTTRAGLGSGGSQQLGQLGAVGGDAPRLVAGEQVRRRATSRLLLEIDVGQRLTVGVADDEAPPIPAWGRPRRPTRSAGKKAVENRLREKSVTLPLRS